jgi:hypothetical protein
MIWASTRLGAKCQIGRMARSLLSVRKTASTSLTTKLDSLKTTLRENETTLFENSPIISALDHINAHSYSGIRRQPD